MDCLFGVLRPTWEFFILMGKTPLPVKWLQILTYTRHSWPLCSEDYLVHTTFCETGHLFVMVISEVLRHSYLLPSVWQWRCYNLFLRLMSHVAGILTPNLLHTRRTLKPTVPPGRCQICYDIVKTNRQTDRRTNGQTLWFPLTPLSFVYGG